MSQAPMSPDVTSDDKLWAALSYIPFIWPIPAVVVFFMEDKKNRPFIRAHNAQALILGIITVLTSGFCIGLLVWVYQLYIAYQAYQGKTVEVPVITNFIKGQGWA